MSLGYYAYPPPACPGTVRWFRMSSSPFRDKGVLFDRSAKFSRIPCMEAFRFVLCNLFFHVFFYNELKGKNELLAKQAGGEDYC